MRRGLLAVSGPVLGLLLATTTPLPVAAQALRIAGSTSVQYVEVRPLERDSVPAESVEGSGLLRQLPDGRVVRCVTGDAFCRGTHPAQSISTVPLIQDLDVSVWGLGEGIHLHGRLRARTAWGADPTLWPRADDAFDLLAAYAELERERFRVRAGRQWKVSGLGFYNFDGATLTVRPAVGLSLEGYAGRSLVRGLHEPRTGGALAAIEALAPEEPGLLLGLQARFRPSDQVAIGTLYQRDVRDDRAGLYSELATLDAVYRIGQASLEGVFELDVAALVLNEARLRARAPPIAGTAVHGELRRYRPYFELWTIWGAFSPVGFDEGRATLVAMPARGLVLRGEGSYRSYHDAGMPGALGDFRADGWGVGGSATWTPAQDWRLEAGYRVELGFGASRSDGHGGVVRHFGDGSFVGVRGLGFQRLYEFRLDQGTVLGLGADASLRLGDRVRLFGGLMGYRHLSAGPAPTADWNQLRGNLRLRWALGSEPGSSGAAGGGP